MDHSTRDDLVITSPSTFSSKKDRGIVIVVSGPPGSGKSTLAKRLAERFKLRYHSTGALFRRIASERGVDVATLDELAKKDPSIDLEIDRIARDEAIRGNVVIDAHIGGWLLRDLSDLSIYVTASLKTRAKRISKRDKKSFEEAMREIISRENAMRSRFKEIYNIDIEDLSVYDLIINTERINEETMIEIASVAVEKIISLKRSSNHTFTDKLF
ncbi:MAG: (d)CMP kinase [Sulfolobales archaeon]|jgi:cytidylate kinase